MLAGNPQLVLEQQVVVMVNAARQRVFDGDQPTIDLPAFDRREHQVKKIYSGGSGQKGLKCLTQGGGLGIRARLALECHNWRRRNA